MQKFYSQQNITEKYPSFHNVPIRCIVVDIDHEMTLTPLGKPSPCAVGSAATVHHCCLSVEDPVGIPVLPLPGDEGPDVPVLC